MANTPTKIDWDCAVTKRHIEEAKATGLKLLGAGRNAFYRTYRFDMCGHEQEITTSRVRDNDFRCGQCLQDKLNSEAKAFGLTLLGAGRNRANRTYRFDQCGHEQEIETTQVRSGKDFKCSQCLQDKLNNEAKATGLKLLGAGRNANYRTYRFDQCGHEQEIRVDKVRQGKDFKCNQCLADKLNEEAVLSRNQIKIN